MKRIIVGLATVLLVVVLMLSTVTLLVSALLRTTVFSQNWYQQAFSRTEYMTGLRAAIEDDLKEQGAYVGIPSEVLIKGLDDDQAYIILRKHMENATDALNYRAPFAVPEYPAERFSKPLMAYAQTLSSQGGLVLSAEQTLLLQEIARDSASIVQARVGILNLTTIQKSSTFKSFNRQLYIISFLSGTAAWVMGVSLFLLMLLYLRRISRFFQFAWIGFWLGGAITGVPLVILDVFGLTRRLSVSPDYLKFAIDQLLTSAVRRLMLWSLMILVFTSIALLVQFILSHHLAEKGREYERRHAHRQIIPEKINI